MDVKDYISEADYVGRFLLHLYHRRVFGNKGKIEKATIRKEFRNYVKNNPFADIQTEKLVTLLLQHSFIYKAKEPKNMNMFKIHMFNFREYTKDLLKRLDEAQKREGLKRITMEHPLGEFKESEKLEVDPNFKEETLTFMTNYMDYANKHFILTSKGCSICQRNFDMEVDYMEHIEYHTQESDFESIRSRSQISVPFFRVSYQICKDSPLLRFCIENLHHSLEIHKVVIVRDSSMILPQEADTPYTISSRERSYFFIDCHTFEIGYEHPIVIVFKDSLSRDASERLVEQHHFLRMEPFKVEMAGVLNLFMPKRGELKPKFSVQEYLPPRDLKESDMSSIYRNCPEFLKYERNKKVIDPLNTGDIYTLLLQLEDTAILNVYSRLTQKKTTVTRSVGYFSVPLKVDYDINVEDILKPGDEVQLLAKGFNKIFGSVEQVFKKRIVFSLRNPKLFKPKNEYDVKFHPFRYHLKLQYRALELLKHNYDVETILFPTKNLHTDCSKVRISVSAYNANLAKNPEQLQAVERIVHHIGSEAPYIIFGPPGTGKTTTIVEAIYQLWKHNPENRILVVGGSNACVDEIAVRLLEVFKEVDPLGKNMLRIYSSAQGQKSEHIDENLIKVSNLCHGYQFYPNLEIVGMYPIVFMTLSIAAKYGHGGLETDHFSHVFVDECGASTEPEVIAALTSAVSDTTRVILAGDPKQLGPVLQSKTAANFGLGVSLLERLMNLECYQVEPESKAYDRSRQIRLTKNFRTHPSILNMSNELYYDNDLEACGRKSVTSWALNWYKLPSPSFPVIFHSVKGKSERRKGSQSLYNWTEICVVMKYIKEMMYFGINGRQMKQSDIGVVTPYKSQVNFIRMELDARKWFEIEVGSVEKFQGQERPVIVFSTVRSQTKGLGFLDSPKRLNVSLTRAQALLIIVGDAETLSASSDFNYVIDYCKGNGAFKGENWSFVTTTPVTDCLMNNFNNLSISNSNLSKQKNKDAPKANKTIKSKSLKHKANHKNQNKKSAPIAQVKPLRKPSNTSAKEAAVPHDKPDDLMDVWLDLMKLHENYDSIPRTPVREFKKPAIKLPQTTNVPPLRDTTLESLSNIKHPKLIPVPQAEAARPPAFQPNHSPSYPFRTNVLDMPTNKPTIASPPHLVSPIRSPSYTLRSGETTAATRISSQPISAAKSNNTTSSMLHRDLRNSELWRDEEKNLRLRPDNTTGSYTALKLPQTASVAPFHHTTTKSYSTLEGLSNIKNSNEPKLLPVPQAGAARSPAFQANHSPLYPLRSNVLDMPTNKPTIASPPHIVSPIRSSSYTLRSGETTSATRIPSQPVSAAPSNSTTSSMLHPELRKSQLWRDEEKNLRLRPNSTTDNYTYKPKSELKKDSARCVVS